MKNKIPFIKTPHLLLREIIPEDIYNIYNGLSNPDVIKHYGISYDSLEATKEQITWFADPAQCWWAICSPDDSIFYGAGGLNNITSEHQKAEIGLWLLPQFWGRGIMREAMPLICDFGFNQIGLHRIEGFVETGNFNCKKAMARLDFKHEGTMNDCEFKNGKFISVEIFAKLQTPSNNFKSQDFFNKEMPLGPNRN